MYKSMLRLLKAWDASQKHQALNQWWVYVGPPSTTSAQHRPNIRSMSRVSWGDCILIFLISIFLTVLPGSVMCHYIVSYRLMLYNVGLQCLVIIEYHDTINNSLKSRRGARSYLGKSEYPLVFYICCGFF